MDKILISGATGLIGQALVRHLISTDAYVIAVVRNREKAIRVLGKESERLKYLVCDVTSMKIESMDVDYVIHAASQTSSKAFVNEPVETIMTAIQGTKNMLDIARKSKVKGFVYLSTMEVYGSPSTSEKIDENHSTNLNTMKVRNCYPESKRMCENLCVSYANEYGVPAKTVRLTQTFGPGVSYDDGRVFAEFARCVIEEKDIILHTKGETRRNYLYTKDAVDAILTVLKKGDIGEAYNAANEETYCSIYEMACLVAEKCANNTIKVIINEAEENQFGYAPVLSMNLDTSKLRGLGWMPTCGLERMFNEMIKYMRDAE